MPTNDNINYGPAPLPGTAPAPVLGNNIDRGPAAVPAGPATGSASAYVPPASVVPVFERPVVISSSTRDFIIPVTEQAVDINPINTPAATPSATNQQRYITVLANGVVITNNATTLNFTGNGVSVSNLGTSGANIVILGGSNYSNSNVSAFLAAFGSNTVLTTGNITAGYFIGNGSQLTGLPASYGNANVVANLAALGTNPVSTTGNVTAGNVLTSAEVIASGVIQTGTGFSTGGYLSVNGATDLHNTTVTGNLSATGNITGNYILGNGSQLTGLPATYGNANVVANLAALGTNPVSTTGNVTAGYFIGNGSALSSLVGSNVTGTVANATYATSAGSATTAGTVTTAAQGNITSVGTLTSLSTTGNITSGNLLTAGLITATGNITGNYFIGNGSQLTGISAGANTGNVTFNDVNIIGTGNLNLQPSAGSSEYLNVYLTGAADIHVAYGGGSGNVILGTDEEANVAVLQGGNVAIQAGNVAGTKTWTFDTAGNLTLPRGGVVYETNIPDGGLNGNTIALKPSGGTNADQQLLIYPTTNDANHLHLTSGNLYSTELFLGDDNLYVKLANTGNIVVNSNDGAGNAAQWTFGTDGNLTVPGGMTVSGNTNVLSSQTALLQPTDNIPLSLISSGTNGATTLFWAEDFANLMTSNIAAIYTPLQGSQTVRIVTGSNGGNIAIYDFDTDGTFTTGKVSATGNISSGNILIGGLISATANVIGGNVLTGGLISATGNITAGNIIATNLGNIASINLNGNASTVLYGNGVFAEVAGGSSYGNANVVANLAALGSNPVSTTGNITSGNILTGGLVSATANVTGGNLRTAGLVSATGNVTGGNVLTGGVVSATGNATAGNIITAGQVSATGNIVTAGNFVGNGAALTNVTVSVAGNVIGTQSNVTLVAGSYNWTFDNTGNLTLPGNTFSVNYANNTQVNAVTRFEGSWTVPVGNSTQSFTVGGNETYQMWVDCNIPNGILVWNATATVTNTNVPVVGQQFAWVYNGGGTPIDFTSIPNQFIGTANAIVRSNVAPSSTTNRFDFGINNTSGGNVNVRYGWIAIS
jgi:hypothetical protein